MRKMKYSGIEWIGEIPEDWEVGRIGELYTERKEKVSDKDFMPLSVTMKGILPQLASAAKSDAHDDRKLVRKGDFAINSRSDRRGSCGISDYDGSVSLINTILTPRNNMNPNYYNWLFHTTLFADEFYKWGHGIVDDLWTTNWSDMKNITIPVPLVTAQQQIADFLDDKVVEIDSVISKTRETIEEYKKLKQSIITELVTGKVKIENEKVCGKYDTYKDSGIEWIEEIPSEWEVKRLKFSSKVRNEKYSENYGVLKYFGLENIESHSAKFVETENIYDITQSQICKKDDIVFGKLRPYLAKVYEVPIDECCSSEFAVFYDFEGCNKYFKYLFLSYGFITIIDASTYGTKMPRANIDFIKNMSITLPCFETQQKIADYLDNKCSEIDTLIAKKEQLVVELEAYKKSLIYEVVTGKRSV